MTPQESATPSSKRRKQVRTRRECNVRAEEAYRERLVVRGGREILVRLSARAAGHVDVMMASGEFPTLSQLICASLGYTRAASERVVELPLLSPQARLALNEIKADSGATDAEILSLAVRWMLEMANRGFKIEVPEVDSGHEGEPHGQVPDLREGGSGADGVGAGVHWAAEGG